MFSIGAILVCACLSGKISLLKKYPQDIFPGGFAEAKCFNHNISLPNHSLAEISLGP